MRVILSRASGMQQIIAFAMNLGITVCFNCLFKVENIVTIKPVPVTEFACFI